MGGYQHEIGLRHTRAQKNQTDAVESVPEVPLRYLIAFVFPITATMRSFLAAKGHAADEVDAMQLQCVKLLPASGASGFSPAAVGGARGAVRPAGGFAGRAQELA